MSLILRSVAQRRVSKDEAALSLAELSGRVVNNLSRTLRTMERYRPVTLTESESGTLVPTVA